MLPLITLLCNKICSSDGCTYPVPANISPELIWNQQCEHEWYSEKVGFLADPFNVNGSKHSAVVDVKPENLTLHNCTDEIYYIIKCHDTSIKLNQTYHVVRDFFNPSPNYKSSGSLDLLWLLMLILILICILIKWRGKICRSSNESVCRKGVGLFGLQAFKTKSNGGPHSYAAPGDRSTEV